MAKVVKQTIAFEKPERSLMKAITFRLLVLISDFTVVSFITKNGFEVIQVVLFTNLSSTVLYYIHERLWNQTNWLRYENDNKSSHKEHIARSLVKSITFRLLVIISDFLITTRITGSTTDAVGIIIFTNLASTIIYFIHERIWNNIHWSKTVLIKNYYFKDQVFQKEYY